MYKICFIQDLLYWNIMFTSTLQLKLYSRHHDRYGTCVTDDHGYDPLVINTFWSFPHSLLVTGFVTKVMRRVPLVEQEVFTIPEHLSSPPGFIGVRVTQSLVLCVMFYRSLFVLWSFLCWPLCCLSFDLRIVIIPMQMIKKMQAKYTLELRTKCFICNFK
jgi:hypothetical protein